MVIQIYKIGSEILGSPQKNLMAQNIKILGKFRTTTEPDREYLQNEINIVEW